jgi:hypothetical protein
MSMLGRAVLWIVILVVAMVMGGCNETPGSGAFGSGNQRGGSGNERRDHPPTSPSQTQTAHTEPFSMDRFAWNNRPLVIFAPSPADPRYRDQLAAVEANRAGFEARDMVWIEVLD